MLQLRGQLQSHGLVHVARAPAASPRLPRGARLKVKLGEVDEITLDIQGTVIERLDDPADTSDDGPVDDAEDDDTVAGPIAIAVDVNEAPADAAAAAPAA